MVGEWDALRGKVRDVQVVSGEEFPLFQGLADQ